VAESVPAPLSALAGIAAPGRFGCTSGEPGVVASERTGFGLASVAARRGARDALAAAVAAAFALELPATPRLAQGAGLAMIWTGPEDWLVLASEEPAQGMEGLLQPLIGAQAAIADQSHARLILRLTGPRVRDVLAKGLPIDLHPRVFRPHDTAVSQISHIGVQIWQLDAAPTYEIAAFRGFAGSFWRWLEASAAEHGLELTG
jgi:sarcosine oxidase subunit gamma